MCVSTFDVSLVSDGLQGGPAGQELLQLVSGLLVVGGVHAGGGLHGCRGENHSFQHIDRHDGRSTFGGNETDTHAVVL